MENATYSGIPPMPDEFYQNNKGRCPLFAPNRRNFFGDDQRADYDNWRDCDEQPEDPALLAKFQAYGVARIKHYNERRAWEDMDMARCHGKWIALVQAWAEYYRNMGDYPNPIAFLKTANP